MKSKIFAALAFILMIAVNFLANSLPINNRTTGAISDAYPNLFAPAGFAFSIWGLIYLLLAFYTVYQFIPFAKRGDNTKEILIGKINVLYITTSIANSCWIFAWHYYLIGISVIIMAALLIALTRIANILRSINFSFTEKLLISSPFSVYFGWITVATIANITVFLVSVGFSGFGVPDYVWTCFVLAVGLIIGLLRMKRDKNIAYGITICWAYLWILYKHISESGFAGQYLSVVITTISCLTVFAYFIFKLQLNNSKLKSI